LENKNAIYLIIGSGVILLGVLAGVAFLSRPVQDGEPPSDLVDETIIDVKIGVMSTTNEAFPIYEFLADLALRDINEYCNASGIDYRFDYVMSNPQGQAGNVKNITIEYHESGIDLIVGFGWSSFFCSSAKTYANETGMVLVSPTSRKIYNMSDTVFQLSPRDSIQAKPLSGAIKSLRMESVVVIQRGDYWADTVYWAFESEFERSGGNILDRIRYPSETTADGFGEYLGEAESALSVAIGEGGIEKVGVLLLSFSESRDILRNAVSYPRLMDAIWFGTEETANDYFIKEEVGEEAAKVKLISPDTICTDTPVYERVNAAFKAEFNETLGYDNANIYDSCWILALSVIEAGTDNGWNVSKVFPGVAESFTGASGICLLDELGDRDPVEFALWGYSEVDGEVRSIRFGTYNSISDEVTWDESLIS
jgi:ABC-type branched-subunit amino acid transport system substrate-binding protein